MLKDIHKDKQKTVKQNKTISIEEDAVIATVNDRVTLRDRVSHQEVSELR
jgi:hypothetical protein